MDLRPEDEVVDEVIIARISRLRYSLQAVADEIDRLLEVLDDCEFNEKRLANEKSALSHFLLKRGWTPDGIDEAIEEHRKP